VSDELEVRELSFDEVVDGMREPLAELEAVLDELEPHTRRFVEGMRAALDRYDADEYDELVADEGT
jgi:hypothetical protein